MTQPPASAGPARPGWLRAVLVAVPVVIVLVVLAVVGWTFLRPVTAGDYNTVRAGTERLIEDYQTEVQFQVTQVANDDGRDLAASQGKANLLKSTVDDFQGRIAALSEERAFNDDELAASYGPVKAGMEDAGAYLKAWGDSMPLVKHMQYVCAEFDAETGYLSSHATAEDFDAAAADCAAAVEQALGVEVQSAVVQARADYLVERRLAWEVNSQARATGTLDRAKSQEAMRLDAQATRNWQVAEQDALIAGTDELTDQIAIVPETLAAFQATIPAS